MSGDGSLAALACMLLGMAGVAWPLFGYGRVLRLLAGCKPDPLWSRAGCPPDRVTVLLAVHNERDGVAARLRNLVDTDLPAERLRIVVASDGSTDGTDDVVRSWPDPRVSLVRSEPRAGKSIAQNAGLAAIDGGIVVITDCGTTFDRRTIPELVAPFADPGVGVVDGALRFEPPPGTHAIRAHGAYWDYEGGVRTHESCLGILATASGAVMAARREVIQPLPGHAGDDCVVPLMAVAAGLRVHRANAACAWDESNADPRAEFRARVRMVVRNWQGTWMFPGLLAPWRSPAVAFGLWSHKLLRWCVPVSVAVALCSLLALAAAWGGPWLWAATIACTLALAGIAEAFGTWATRGRYRASPLGSFALVCGAFGMGLAKVAAGHRIGGYRDRAARALLLAALVAFGARAVRADDAIQPPPGWELWKERTFVAPRTILPPFGIVASSDGQMIYVGSGGGESFSGGGISAIDPRTGLQVRPRIQCGRNCTALLRTGNWLVAVWRGSEEVTLVDLARWTVVDHRPLGFMPLDAAAEGNSIAVVGPMPGGGAVARFRITEGGALEPAGVDRIEVAPYRVVLRDGAAIVSCPPSGSVRWIRPGATAVVHRTDGAPLAIAGWSGDAVLVATQEGRLLEVSESSGVFRTIDLAPLAGLDRAKLELRILDPAGILVLPGNAVIVGMFRVPGLAIALPAGGPATLLGRVALGSRYALRDRSGSTEVFVTRHEGGIRAMPLRLAGGVLAVGEERQVCGTTFPMGWAPLRTASGPDVVLRRSDSPSRLQLAFESDPARGWIQPKGAEGICDALASLPGGGVACAFRSGDCWRFAVLGGQPLPEHPCDGRAPFQLLPAPDGFLSIDRFRQRIVRFDGSTFTTIQAPRPRPRSAARLADGRWIVIHDTNPDAGFSLLDGNACGGFVPVDGLGWPSAIVAAPGGSSAYVSFFSGWVAEVDAGLRVVRKRRMPVNSLFTMHGDASGRICITSENESVGLLLDGFDAEPRPFRIPGLLDLVPLDDASGAVAAISLDGVRLYRPAPSPAAP